MAQAAQTKLPVATYIAQVFLLFHYITDDKITIHVLCM